MMRKLPRTFVEKPWGVDRIPKEFCHSSDEPVGEVWFTPPPELQELLVKFIFTSERLSVQVHPNDTQAHEMGVGVNGKSECWVIVDADPGATIAVGFKRRLDALQLREAALDGSIVDDLVWHEVRRGDAFYIPAGTVHAIGGGVSLIEVQQNSDSTFRLYDYGRPRELHLDQAIAVADPGPYPATLRSQMDAEAGELVNGPHFRLSYLHIVPDRPDRCAYTGSGLVIPFSGSISIGGEPFGRGDCAFVEDLAIASISGSGVVLIAAPNRPGAKAC